MPIVESNLLIAMAAVQVLMEIDRGWSRRNDKSFGFADLLNTVSRRHVDALLAASLAPIAVLTEFQLSRSATRRLIFLSRWGILVHDLRGQNL